MNNTYTAVPKIVHGASTKAFLEEHGPQPYVVPNAYKKELEKVKRVRALIDRIKNR